MQALGRTVVLLLVPLIPAVLLYYLFGTLNSATFGISREGIQTGGPIAAYLIVLYAGIKTYRHLSEQKDVLGPLKQQLAGDWVATSDSLPSGSEATGRCTATVDNDGDLSITGDLAYSGGAKKGTALGSWSTLKVWRDGGELRYVYFLTEPATKVEWCGEATLNLQFRKRWLGFRTQLAAMTGTWKVYGPTTKTGTLAFRRA